MIVLGFERALVSGTAWISDCNCVGPHLCWCHPVQETVGQTEKSALFATPALWRHAKVTAKPLLLLKQYLISKKIFKNPIQFDLGERGMG